MRINKNKIISQIIKKIKKGEKISTRELAISQSKMVEIEEGLKKQKKEKGKEGTQENTTETELKEKLEDLYKKRDFYKFMRENNIQEFNDVFKTGDNKKIKEKLESLYQKFLSGELQKTKKVEPEEFLKN
jgi:hypothetical protein